MTLTELAIKRPSIVVVAFAALGLLGLVGALGLRYELLPKIQPPVVTISTLYPGAAPAEVESSVSERIEEAVSGLEKTSQIRSYSYEGLSLVVIEFATDVDIDLALQEAQRKINPVLPDLPEEARTPVVQKVALDEMPVLKLGLTSTLPPREFYTFVEDQLKPLFATLSGVGKVDLIGGEEREIRVNLDAEKIHAYSLSIPQVTAALRASNLDFPTGSIEGDRRKSTVRIAGKFASVEALRELVVARSIQGGEIRLRDLAEVEDGIVERATISRINGLTAIGMNIVKQADGNAVEVSRKARQRIAELEEEYAGIGLKFAIANDASVFTLEAADAVKHDLALAILLVAGVMFVFLHSLRNSLIVLVAIPCSLVAAFVAMWLLDYTLNLMTLLALSLVIGILVDDSIVVLENIHHHLEKGKAPPVAALEGRNEIGFAALSITLVDVVVFVPLIFITGLTGDIIREFAVVVVVSTLMSLFVSFTVTPALASRFARLEPLGYSVLSRFGDWFERGFQRLVALYVRLQRWSLAHRWAVLLGAFLLFAGALALPALGLVGSEFIKQSDRGEFVLRLKLQPGTTLEGTNRVARQVERELALLPEVLRVFTTIGQSKEGSPAPEEAQLSVTLVPRQERSRATMEIAGQLQALERQIPGAQVYIDQIAITGEQGHAPINVLTSGSPPDSLARTAGLVAEALNQTPGVYDVNFSAELGRPETRIEIDRQQMAQFGLRVAEVGSTLQVALAGDADSKFSEGGREYPIRIQLDRFDRSSPEDLARLSFATPGGDQVQLQQFARIFQETGPARLERTNRQASVMVMAYVEGRPVGSAVEDFRQRLGAAKAAGTTFTLEGDAKNQAESFQSLLTALILGISFVYLIMVALYDSYLYPLVVLFSIPVAIVGALGALALAGEALSIFSMLGIIMLIGLVAKNGILLVDRATEVKAQGMGTTEALLEAGQSRLRPIAMTTLAMSIGMLPIALAGGAGAEWKNGLAWALIGGLTSSMFLTLLLIPVVYAKADRWKERFPILLSHPRRLLGWGPRKASR